MAVALKEGRQLRRGEVDYRLILWFPYSDMIHLPIILNLSGNDYAGYKGSREVKIGKKKKKKLWVEVASPPSPYARSPNYRAMDRTAQATDGALLVVWCLYGSITKRYFENYFGRIKAAYEGTNASEYGQNRWGKIEAPTPIELRLRESVTQRPVSIILWEPTPEARKSCQSFVAEHPEYNFRVYEFDQNDGLSKWDAILADMIADVIAGRGIKFSPPKNVPWNAPNTQYNTLNIAKRNETKSGFWKRVFGALIGH